MAVFHLQSRDINHYIIRREIIKDIALREITEAQVSGQRHGHAGEHADAGRVVGNAREAVHSRCFERAVDEEAIVVADEGEGDDADGLEDAVVNQEAPFELAAKLGCLDGALRYDGQDDDHHRDQGEA